VCVEGLGDGDCVGGGGERMKECTQIEVYW